MSTIGRCQAVTLSGLRCQKFASVGKVCFIHTVRPAPIAKEKSLKKKSTPRDPVKVFRDFENQVWEGTYKGTCQTALDIIKNYAKELYQTEKLPWETKKIKEAPKLIQVRVQQSEPGTGKGTSQFYKFAKAIHQGKVTCENINLDQLKALIHTYVFDQIE